MDRRTDAFLAIACVAIAGGLSCRYAPPVMPPPADAVVFRADPPTIEPGESATLIWNVPGASKVSIQEAVGEAKLRDVGSFASHGSLAVQPVEDSTYVIACEEDSKVSCASVRVRIRVKPR